jgi:hypothetical protein
MEATLPTQNVSNARQLDKEVVQKYHAIGLFNGEMREIIDCRLYMSRSGDGASPVYCSLWILGGEHWTSGRGTASGYGYHKCSAAVSSALSSAGVILTRDDGAMADISGVGDSAIEEAFRAIGAAMGADQVLIVS